MIRTLPLFLAIAAMLSDDPKWVLLTLMPLFVVGGLLLFLVRTPPQGEAGQ